MACLTPGVLVKLIERMDMEEDRGGERRTPLLQVVSIVPVLSEDNPWRPNQGFYLKVSDSSHAAFVSLPREYDEMILSNKLQIGQFIHVQKLEHALPVPVLRGVKPLPRRHAYVGCPKDLVMTANSQEVVAPSLDFPSSIVLGQASPKPRSMSASRIHGNDDYISGKRSLSFLSSRSVPTTPHVQCSLKKTDTENVGSPVIDGLSKMSIACVDEDDADFDGSMPTSQSLAQPATIARRSWDVGTTPKIKERPGAKNGAGLSRARSVDIFPSQLVRSDGSESHSSSSNSLSTSKTEGEKSSNNDRKKPITTNTQSAARAESEPASKVLVASAKRKIGVVHNPSSEAIDGPPTKSTYHGCCTGKRWTENGVAGTSLSSDLVKLGKEVSRYRDSAVLAAVDALQEAAAMEKLIKCLCIYSELLSKKDEPQITVESFLNLQDDLKEAITVTRSLKIEGLGSKDSNMWNHPNNIKEAAKIKLERKKRAATWVKSALASDLSPPSPLTRPPLHPSESPTTCRKLTTRRKPAVLRQSKMDELQMCNAANVAVENKNMEWIKGSSKVASTDLTEVLLVDSKRWFLEYVDKFLDGITSRSKHTQTQTESQIAGVLCLVKKVDNWLTKQGCASPENVEEMRAHGKLRKKIYRILLSHVESAAIALESIGSASNADDGKVGIEIEMDL